MPIAIILKYFPQLTQKQANQLEQLFPLYLDWNQKINVISRKDINSLYERHILHSLGIAKVIEFMPNTKILDVGTGGGIPGIPLSILFPSCQFHLIDSIGKKIKVVNAIINELGLHNITAEQIRAEKVNEKYDFIVSRAVTQLPIFVKWVKDKINTTNFNFLPNGIIYLKGGEIENEIKVLKNDVQIFTLSNYFDEDYFETKKAIYIPI